ncbi:MAG: hypothetical protein PHI63_03555 [Patescibacteria group bacterium]|nr:hypothetical protein [Patescibacteria group bacterium]
MLKKLAIGASAIALAVATVPMFAAFEAHIINVTAKIENALSVRPEAIDYGTVFPQEKLDKSLSIGLSESFAAQNRVDVVEYVIRQKPKCEIIEPTTEKPQYVPVSGENAQGEFLCPEGYRQALLLCPYLSKTSDGGVGDVSVKPFHGPITGWTMADTSAWEASGVLVKANDSEDTWTIDLKVPCFAGMCAQDWNTFVKTYGPEGVVPANYVQPAENEHKNFGCDLWIETTEISKLQLQPV